MARFRDLQESAESIGCFLMLLGLLAVACLLPPELHPAGLALETGLSGCLAWILLRSNPSSASPAQIAFLGLAGFFFIPSILVSPQKHLIAASLLPLLPASLLFLAAKRQAGDSHGRERLAGILIALGTLVSAWGILQSAFTLTRTAHYLRGLGQRDLDPLILRAESGRAFGPFLLPADLAILVAMILPLTLRWHLREPRGGRRILAAGALLVQAGGLASTRSYGGILSLLVASLLLVPFSSVERRWRLWWSLLVAVAIAAGGIFLVRGAEGFSPLSLRMGNWLAAWRVFTSHPLSGVGLGNFGDAITRELGPGMNETVFAHNSYLQLACECGISGLLLILLGIGKLFGRIARGLAQRRGSWDALAFAIPPVAFLIQNLFDFSAYLPSLLLIASGVAALAVPGRLTPAPRPAVLPSLGWRRGGAFALILAGMTAWGLREAWTLETIRLARESIEENQMETARQRLARAAEINPDHPDPPAILSELLLDKAPAQPAAALEGERWARRAVALRPSRAYGHYVLSLYLASTGDPGEAWLEVSRAKSLYPARELYQSEEARLRRLLDISESEASHGAR